MLKALLFKNSFIIKRVVTFLTGLLAMVFGQDVAGSLAELLMDPAFIQRVFEWVGAGLTIYSLVVRKDVSGTQAKLDEVEQTITEYLPKEMDLDPYPGWDYDPIQGWVKSDS